MDSTSQEHRGLVTVVLTGATFLAGLDLFIVNVAFDEIGRDLAGSGGGPSLGQLSWILNAYAVVYAALLVPMGRLTDRYGRKSGFVTGLVLFTAASLACALSTSVWELVAFRVVQAIGAAAMTPTSLGLLLAALPEIRRAPAARLWALTGAVAAAFGPAAGGGLVQISWHWAFLINVPIGIVLVVLAVRVVPDVRHNLGAPRPDLLGAAVLAVAIAGLVLGLVQADEWGWLSAGVLGGFAVAVAGVAGFGWLTTHHPSPVIDPALLRVRTFALANVTTVVFNTAFGASLLLGILWMQQAWGYSALRTGLAVAVGPLLVPVTSVLAARLLRRARPGRLIAAGSLCFGLAAAWQAVALSTTPAYLTSFLPAWLLAGVGVGLAMPNLVAAATAGLPAAQAATGGGVLGMARQVGLAIGVAILVSIVGEAATRAHVHTAWIVLAAISGAAAFSALTMEAVREPVAATLADPV